MTKLQLLLNFIIKLIITGFGIKVAIEVNKQKLRLFNIKKEI